MYMSDIGSGISQGCACELGTHARTHGSIAHIWPTIVYSRQIGASGSRFANDRLIKRGEFGEDLVGLG